MQIATTMFYDNASRRMTTLSDRANVLQTQIATGKRVQSPEEDAALAQQVAEFDRKSADTTVYQNNLTLAGAQLNQADGVMTSMTAQIQRAQELAIQASNGTQTLPAISESANSTTVSAASDRSLAGRLTTPPSPAPAAWPAGSASAPRNKATDVENRQ